MTPPTFDADGRYEAVVEGWRIQAHAPTRRFRVKNYHTEQEFGVTSDGMLYSLSWHRYIPLPVLEAAIAAWRGLFQATGVAPATSPGRGEE